MQALYTCTTTTHGQMDFECVFYKSTYRITRIELNDRSLLQQVRKLE